MVGPARVGRLSVATEIRVDRVAGRYAHGNSNFGLTQPTTNKLWSAVFTVLSTPLG